MERESSTPSRLLARLLRVTSPGEAWCLVGGTGVLVAALACPSLAVAQGQRSAYGVAACPPPPGEYRCHPGGDPRYLWVYNQGELRHEPGLYGKTVTAWHTGGNFVVLEGENRLISASPLVIQVPVVHRRPSNLCIEPWSIHQPPCHPRCDVDNTGFAICDDFLVRYVEPSSQAYKRLPACPPPPGERICAIRGRPGWIEEYPYETPSPYRFDALLSLRFGGGPISYWVPGAPGRGLAGSFEVTAGSFLEGYHESRDQNRWLLVPEIGYARDWGQGYGGHAFIAGAGIGYRSQFHSLLYVPHAVVKEGFSPGIRHGLRYSYIYSMNLEFQHQHASNSQGNANHVGLFFSVDPVAFVPILAKSVHGRPLQVQGDARVASLSSFRGWA